MEIVYYNLIAWFLEMVGDRVHNLAFNVLRLQQFQNKQGDNEIIERLSQMSLITFTMFDKAVKSIFDGKIKVASDAVDLHDAVEEEEKSLLKDFQDRTDPDLAAVVSSLAWELKIIAEHSSALAEIAINNVLIEKNEVCSLAE
jgi:phosphate uptake regulator